MTIFTKNHQDTHIMKTKLLTILFLLSLLIDVNGQNHKIPATEKSDSLKFNYKSLIAPTALIGFGYFGMNNKALRKFNNQIKDEVTTHIDKKFTIDDISQYSPLVSVYALNALGIKGKNNFIDRTLILGTAYFIMGTTVIQLKRATKIRRPDNSSMTSFPSGHTATAFMAAEFLRQEYKDVSVWYGIAGYTVATCTGLFRIYNNRHWLTDVAAGAGIGIISTQLAYKIYPWIKKKIFKSKKVNNLNVLPYYNGQEAGLSLSFSLQN